MKMEPTMQQMRRALIGQCNTQSMREVEHYTEHYLFIQFLQTLPFMIQIYLDICNFVQKWILTVQGVHAIRSDEDTTV